MNFVTSVVHYDYNKEEHIYLHNVHACKQTSRDVHVLLDSRKKVLKMCILSLIL